MDTNYYDAIIVGGGAAGLSAALVLSRARRRVVVLDAGSPRNAPAPRMQGFLSRDGMPPAELLAAGRGEVEGYGGVIVSTTVERLTREPGDEVSFLALLADGTSISGRKVVITTGMHDVLPDVPGLGERWARDVLHCPYCHGYEVRDEPLGVLWNGPGTPAYAQIVRQWSDDVVLFAPAGTLTDGQREQLTARAIGVVEGTVTRLEVTDDRLTGVVVDDHRVVPRDALFVPPAFAPHSQLLQDLGCEVDDDGWVVTGPAGSTSVDGVRVAGNVANPRAQVITAAGEGSAVAIAVNAELVDDDVSRAVRELRSPS
jgi:thioredoxin reductase